MYVAHCTSPEWTCLFGGCDTLTACSYTPRQPSGGTVILAVQMCVFIFPVIAAVGQQRVHAAKC